MLSTKTYSSSSLTKLKSKPSLAPWQERVQRLSPIKAWETACDFRRSHNKAQNQAYISRSFINIHKTTPRHMHGERGCHVVLIVSPSGRILVQDSTATKEKENTLKAGRK